MRRYLPLSAALLLASVGCGGRATPAAHAGPASDPPPPTQTPADPPPVESKTTAPVPAGDPIVGKWAWFNGGAVTILSDGAIVHELGNRGSWAVQDRAKRVYILRWGQGDFVDTVTLSEDGQSLSGMNQGGVAVSARRMPEARPEPWLPSAPPPAGPGAAAVALKTTDTVLGKVGNATPSLPVTSPDQRHQMYLTWANGKTYVVLDGAPGKQGYDAVDHLLFSADGKRTAFMAMRGGQYYAVIDGVESTAADEVTQLQFSPDGKRVAYVLAWRQPARAAMAHRVVIDAETGPTCNAVWDLQFSPDGKHVAYIADRGSALNDHVDSVVIEDGKAGKSYSSIVGGSLQFLPGDDRLSFVATIDQPHPMPQKVVPVIGGVEGPDMGVGGGELHFSPDGKHVAAVTSGGAGTTVAVDGKPGKAYNGTIMNVTFSPDGRRLAFTVVNQRTAKFTEVVDGKEGAPYDEIRDFQFGPDGARFAYIAKKDGFLEMCVTDAGEEKGSILISNLTFSPDGKHVAYTALGAGGSVVVRDGKEEKPYFQILEHSLRFSPDGKRLAYLAMTPKGLVVVADGAEGKAYSFNGSLPGLAFSPDGKRLAYVAMRQDGTGVIVVDGVETAPFDRPLEAPVAFDDANHLHVLAVRADNLIRLEVAITVVRDRPSEARRQGAVFAQTAP